MQIYQYKVPLRDIIIKTAIVIKHKIDKRLTGLTEDILAKHI